MAPKRRNRQKLSRPQTASERETFLKSLAPSKYQPHLGKTEIARQLERLPLIKRGDFHA